MLTILSGAPLLTATAHAAPDPNPRASQNNDRRNRDNRDDYRNNRDDSFTGVVTNVRGDNRFDARANNQIYNVTTDDSLPRALSVGDTVRVSGQFYGDSDVRRANVSAINDGDSNRYDNRNDNRDGNRYDDRNDSSPRNYRGTVEILLPGNEFNARIDGRIYKIYSLESTRDLRLGDPITIYGQMDRGANIRSARVTVENYRNNGQRDNNYRDDKYRDNKDHDNDYRDNKDRDDKYRDNNYRNDNGRPGGYDGQRDFDTYFGEVTDVRNSREFDIDMDGRTYNVYADKSTKHLNRGDIVRVYGKRVGTNDIREAKVNITRNR